MRFNLRDEYDASSDFYLLCSLNINTMFWDASVTRGSKFVPLWGTESTEGLNDYD